MMKLAASLCMLAIVAGGEAAAAELRVLATNGLKPAMAEIAPKFEQATGHRLSIRYEGSAILQEEIARGDSFDVAMSFEPNMEAVTRAGRIDRSSLVGIARSGLGVAVRAGQPKPDISTVEAFKRAMLGAGSIAYATRGASGVHFIAVCERLGIAEQVKAKGKTRPTGMIAELVAHGEAEIAVQQMSELVSTPGIDVVGPFPAEINLVSRVVVGISPGSKEPEAGKALITFLATPAVVAMIRAKGLEPD